ncbi:MAG TPA: EamA family transporter RarD, partial [Stellaceae bacterium]|nr:EamA family transporter RarD [Stellaceae bacterium]
VYLKLLKGVPVFEILGHRIVWGALFALIILAISASKTELIPALHPRTLTLLFISAALITANWLIYIIAITSDHVLQMSLGYFMNPLVNVILGTLVLGERLSRLQLAACLIAGVGVAFPMVAAGEFPWISLGLALAFGVYGLVRKVAPVSSLVGFFIEAVFLTLFAGPYLLWLGIEGKGAFTLHDPGEAALLIGAGIATAVPLIWFAAAARKLPLSTLGLIQYLGPTMSFLLGIIIYREPFTWVSAVTFGCIWSALALYSTELIRARRS